MLLPTSEEPFGSASANGQPSEPPTPPEADPLLVLAVLAQDYQISELTRERCGIGRRQLEHLLCCVREAVIGEGFVLED